MDEKPCQRHAMMLFNSELVICFSVQKCGCDFTSYLTLSLVQNTSTCINLLDVEIMYFLILFEFSSEHFSR